MVLVLVGGLTVAAAFAHDRPLVEVGRHDYGTGRPFTFYLETPDTPPSERLGLSSKQLRQEEITVFDDIESFKAAVREYPPLSVWINGLDYGRFPVKWLGLLRRSGTVIVVINAPIGDMTTEPGQPPDSDKTFVVQWQYAGERTNPDGTISRVSGSGGVNHYYAPDDPSFLLATVHQGIQEIQNASSRQR